MRGVTISGAASAGVFVRSGLTEISDSRITMNAIGLEDDTNATINVANSVISYNITDSLPIAPSTILLANNNTFFANNGTGGAGGSALVVTHGPAAIGSREGAATIPPDDRLRPDRR
jgi:hypothetical protein